jgi:hypothetical protein
VLTSTTDSSKDFYGAGDGRYNKDVMESGGSVYTKVIMFNRQI